MRRQYDDFTQLKVKDMSKSISDMTYRYINPENNEPTKVPYTHYEKILNQVTEKYMADITSRQFLTIMYNQLTALKKEDERYFKEALICMDMGVNPKDMRIEDEIALSFTYDCAEDSEKQDKKGFHLLNEDIVNNFEQAKKDPELHSVYIKHDNLCDDLDNKKKDDWER